MGGARILIEDSFHLSCTAVSGSWIKDLFIYFFFFYREEKTNPDNKYMTNRKID